MQIILKKVRKNIRKGKKLNFFAGIIAVYITINIELFLGRGKTQKG